MSTKAVLETSPNVRDRAKIVAAQNRVSVKSLTTLLMDRGLKAIETGEMSVEKTTGAEIVPSRTSREGGDQ